LALSGACGARAEDHFLVMGGGYSPTGNQLSLESNVLYFQQALRDLRIDKPDLHILFADGDDPGRDLQYQDAGRTLDSLPNLLAEILGPSRDIAYNYRSSRIPGVSGACTQKNLDGYFRQVAPRLAQSPSDHRLLIYFTGHGGKSASKGTPNTRTYHWNDQEMTMKQWVERLDKLPRSLPVVLVMVQCYSGGFAHVIFKDGEPDAGMADHDRAGFFATVPDRQAAGCTAQIDAADYHEYSTHFWEALCGRSRLGRDVPRPDYDGDGTVSFLEAHAYVCIHSDTIDIPVKTTDVFLRRYSKSGPSPGLLTADSPLDKLLAVASPAARAVVAQLSASLDLKGPSRAAEARKLAALLEDKRKSAEAEHRKVARDYGSVRRDIADAVRSRWPELTNPWHPAVADLLAKEGRAIDQAIRDHPDWAELNRLGGKSDELDQKRDDLEVRWCKTQRLIRWLETAALEANLPRVAAPAERDRFARLTRLENGTIGK
jgi:hypothetical protein